VISPLRRWAVGPFRPSFWKASCRKPLGEWDTAASPMCWWPRSGSTAGTHTIYIHRQAALRKAYCQVLGDADKFKLRPLSPCPSLHSSQRTNFFPSGFDYTHAVSTLSFFFFFLRQGLAMWPSQMWPWTHDYLPPPKCWDYRHAPTHLTFYFILISIFFKFPVLRTEIYLPPNSSSDFLIPQCDYIWRQSLKR
jgi:hypothetical protein